MKVSDAKPTTRQARKSITGWLKEERATATQALQLLDALYAGAIDGGYYTGERKEADRADKLYYALDQENGGGDGAAFAEKNKACGCLVDSIERIRDARPQRKMGLHTAETFWFATMIPLGATPTTNRWARAAAKGIEDYLETL